MSCESKTSEQSGVFVSSRQRRRTASRRETLRVSTRDKLFVLRRLYNAPSFNNTPRQKFFNAVTVENLII